MKRLRTWISSLFENKPKRKKYKLLTKRDVEACEEMIENYNRETVCDYFEISKTTYFTIKKGKHRYSTRRDDVR